MGEREALKEVLRRNAGPGSEQPVEVVLGEAGNVSQGGKIRLFAVVLVKIANDCADAVVIVHATIVAPGTARRHPVLASSRFALHKPSARNLHAFFTPRRRRS